jgi:N utilization substance protein B
MVTEKGPTKHQKDLSRGSARELVFQAMYASDSGGSSSNDTLTRFFSDRGFVGENTKFARRLIEGVGKNQSAIDLKIVQFASAFPLEAMSPVDRAILRLAVYELLFDTLESDTTPASVAINEAVKIAKKFGSESSGRFINGVLGGIVRGEDS